MYERFVFVKLKDAWSHPEGREEIIAAIRGALPGIPGVLACRAGVPASEDAARGWDLCIALRFETEGAIEAYRVHPDHQRFLDEVLTPRAEMKKVWNFAMQELAAPP